MDQYQTILNRDKQLAANFVHKESAGEWISVIQHIAPWLYKEQKKGLWEVVRAVSEERGYIKEKVSRKAFAQMVFTFCKEALKEDETSSRLISSMAHYKCYDAMKDKEYAKTIEGFFDGNHHEGDREQHQPTIASRLEEYMRKTIVENPNQMPCNLIRINPDYGNDMAPTLAIEKYQKKEFLDKKKPSYIEAYICINCELDKNQLRNQIQIYSRWRNVKLYFVGEHGLRKDVRNLAEECNVGYVRLNPKRKMTQDDYILQRAIGDSYSSRHYMDMMLGAEPMDCPILIFDGQRLTTSLADSLQTSGIAVNSVHVLKAPELPFDDIEAKANALTKDYVEALLSRFAAVYKALHGHLYVEDSQLIYVREDGHSYVKNVPVKNWMDFSIDPFELARREKIHYDYCDLPENQLGRIDLLSGSIMLNNSGDSNYDRLRFTMAHEFGHNQLHRPLLQSQGICSFGDTEDSLLEMMSIRDEDTKWFERQANHFASCLLMPSRLVCVLFSALHKEFVEDVYGDKLGPIYYNENQPETYFTYNMVVGGMAKMLNVSTTAMKLRLKRMNLCIE